MATIYVKTKEGRVAFYNGKPIPHDKFIPVSETSGMRRLVDVWEDVEVQAAPAAKSPDQRRPAPMAPNPVTPATAAPKKETN
jgi:hypothetical protein